MDHPAVRFGYLAVFAGLSLLESMSSMSTASAQAGTAGHITCVVSENGHAASGTLILTSPNDPEHPLASGTCGTPLSVPAGSYIAVVQLDGALDQPKHRETIEVEPQKTRRITASFATGNLTIQAEGNGRRAAAQVSLLRGEVEVGRTASGVPARVSAGEYTIVVRWRGREITREHVRVAPASDAVVVVEFPAAPQATEPS